MSVFNATDIDRNFDLRDRNSGRSYQHRGQVRELRVENGGLRITAKVQGTAAKPYEVTIAIEKRKGPKAIHCECTCPVRYMCKHGAAALYEAIAQLDRQREKLPVNRPYDEGRRTAQSLNGNLTAWVNTIEKQTPGFGDSEQTLRLIYIIGHSSHGKKPKVTVTPHLKQRAKNGTWDKSRFDGFQQILLQNQHNHFFTEEDHAVFRLLNPGSGLSYGIPSTWHAPEDPELIDLFLSRVIDTGRAFTHEGSTQALHHAAPVPAQLAWTVLPDGKQKPIVQPSLPGLTVLMSNSLWYINPLTQETGPLQCGLSFDQVQDFLDAPPLTARDADALRKHLLSIKTPLPLPYRVVRDEDAKPIQPKPHIQLQRVGSSTKTIARLTMNYAGTPVDPSAPSPTFHIIKKDKMHLHKRNKKLEAQATKQIAKLALTSIPNEDRLGLTFGPPPEASPWFWLSFMHETALALRQDGFTVEADADCGLEVLSTDEDTIEASFTQTGAWWFSLDLGITINGQRTALLPILVSFLRDIHSPADLERLTGGERCYAPLPDGRYVALPSDRVKTILQTLLELFNDKPLDEKGRLRVSFDLAAALVKIKDVTRERWLGEGQLKNLVAKLGDFNGIAELPLPAGFLAELRPYQKQGYDWLHFLGKYNLGGVLADDMGLGKTVQTLAYLLSLKKHGKLGNSLIVMPTSLITNWQTEAERFAPALKVLTLHGNNRVQRFKEIPDADLVLTTYPLIIRDIENLRAHKWGLVILDEAQAIKNPTSKMMQAVCMLEAKQRLCLTGTPVENHLGEIWSIFAFLMPGLLGDYRSFTKLYRTPIEKNGDIERQNLLSRRLRPFILRRLKSDVAKELPPKTEIIQRVTFGDDQRDLYETVRHVMNEKVREVVADKGFARSQIVILDALLKLRQVCCDPRLVKIAAASKAKSSAKLDMLLEMLPTLIEDGRRILLFSQFTSMLDLIKPALDTAGITYVELRGNTKDRRTPISRFQKKEVPLFLISLKAGGTGLNITTADTVIHFDPWWNPSAENQATDRAHRIGQDKPVFVYKFIAEGTIEERILDLQHKKAHLATALLGDSPAAASALTQDDLQWIMESV